MIRESYYWKTDLLRYAKSLRRRLAQRKWVERSHVSLEKTLMLGFYIVRKLIEAKKLSDSVSNQKVEVISYPPTGKRVTFINWDKLDQLYELSKGRSSSVKASFLANQFIHSYVFAPCFKGDGTLDGAFVSSDRDSNHLLRFVAIGEVIRLFESVGNDDPDEVRMVFNRKQGDYDVSAFTRGLKDC